MFETALLPQLSARKGAWALGPTFSGSALLKADADLIAAGLLLELKTSSKKLALPVIDILQVIGYVLLDFEDEFQLDALGIFNARYACLTIWEMSTVLPELARHEVSLQNVRSEFRQLLTAGATRSHR